MHFVYTKQINIASEYNYPIDGIVDWFIKNYNLACAFETNDISEPVDIVYAIFSTEDSWYDNFVHDYELEDDLIENLSPRELVDQIEEATTDKLLDYYTKHWNDIINE